MAEFDRLSERITWIDLSFVERDRTSRWAIEVEIRCHLAGMSQREVSKPLEVFGIKRSHVAIHNWVHKADLQPTSAVSEDQLAVDEKMIRLHGRKFWLYDAVDPQTNEILHVSLYPTANKQTTRWFLTELHRRYQLNISDPFSLKTALDTRVKSISGQLSIKFDTHEQPTFPS